MLWMWRLLGRKQKPSLEKESLNLTRSLLRKELPRAGFTKFAFQAIFISFWQMSETFYMRTLRRFLDSLCLENFGWFYTSLGRAWSSQYMTQWSLNTLATFLTDRKFNNCSD